MANASNVNLLVKFFVPAHRDDLVPYGFERIDEMPKSIRHFNKLKRVGLKDLAVVGRVRPGKRDSGTNIASPDMASAPKFLQTMEQYGLAILSAKRFADDKWKGKPRFVVTLGIGFGEGIAFKKADQEALQKLFQNTWQQCHVWDNSAPREAGVHTVDTINFTGCLEKGAKALYELRMKEGADGAVDLDWSPLNPAAKPLSLSPKEREVA
jgi:hypothetical protein